MEFTNFYIPNTTLMMKMIKRSDRIPKKRTISGADTPTDGDRIVPFGVCNYAKYNMNYKAIVLNLNLVELDNNTIIQNLQSSFFSNAPDRNTMKAQNHEMRHSHSHKDTRNTKCSYLESPEGGWWGQSQQNIVLIFLPYLKLFKKLRKK